VDVLPPPFRGLDRVVEEAAIFKGDMRGVDAYRAAVEAHAVGGEGVVVEVVG
jgi:hypothetical protein